MWSLGHSSSALRQFSLQSFAVKHSTWHIDTNKLISLSPQQSLSTIIPRSRTYSTTVQITKSRYILRSSSRLTRSSTSIIPYQSRFFTLTLPKTTTMSSDADYEAFLNKAQSDRENATTSSDPSTLHVAEIQTEDVPNELHALHSTSKGTRVYTSDADEPFIPVSLKYEEDHDVDLRSFEKVTGTKGAKEIKSKEWDPKGEYADVIKKVEETTKAKHVSVFEVDGKGSRVWFWIVAKEKGGKRLLGYRVLSVGE